MTLERSTDWDAKLQAYLDAKRMADEPCGVFAAGAIEAMTGTDLLVHFKGRLQWARANLPEAVGEVLEPRGVAFARAGDLVMKGGNLGVCNGPLSFFVTEDNGQTGLGMVDTLTCEHAWTVG